MTPATRPRDNPLDERLLWIDPGDRPGHRPGHRQHLRPAHRPQPWRDPLPGPAQHQDQRRFGDARVGDLPGLLRRGDLLIVNDAATLPASLPASVPGPAGGASIEVRLLREHDDGGWDLVLFGAGDWRTPTEHRPPPPLLMAGQALLLGPQQAGADPLLRATIEHVSPVSPRLCRVRFDRADAALWSAIYRIGRPVQYAYLKQPLDLWLVQTRFGSRPWAVEMPSAGRPLTWELLLHLRRAGVRLATLTHGAGLSATGDPALDQALPSAERFDLPPATLDAIFSIKPHLGTGGRPAARPAESANTPAPPARIIAVGTTVVRALEGCAVQNGGLLRPGRGETDLRIDPRHNPGFRPRVVDGLLTGLHEAGASHLDLLRAFVPADLLASAYAHAEAHGYLCHEFGDSSLILPS